MDRGAESELERQKGEHRDLQTAGEAEERGAPVQIPNGRGSFCLIPLPSRFRCLREDVSASATSTLERLALVRELVLRMREIERELKSAKGQEVTRQRDEPR